MNYCPLISIVVPVYNNEKTIVDCLTSLVSQTYKNFEVVVVDNNSIDNTKKIVERFRALDSRVVYCIETVQSRGAARHAGVRQACGEIIVSINADCVFGSDWLEKLTSPIRYGAAVAVAGSDYYTGNSYWATQLNFFNRQYYKRQVKNSICTSSMDTKNFAIKADILKLHNFDPAIKNLCDLDLFMRLKSVTKIFFLDGVEVRDIDYLSFKQIMKTYFWRGYWMHLIYHKYSQHINRRTEIMFESTSFFNNVTFPFWLLIKVFTCWPTRSFFIITTEVSWRFGLLYYFLKH